METNLSKFLKPNVPKVSELDTKHQLHPWHSMGCDKVEYMVASKAEGIYIYDAFMGANKCRILIRY